MKFKIILVLEKSDGGQEEKQIGEMTLKEAREFAGFLQEGETNEGYTFDMMQYSVDENKILIFLTC